MANKTDGRAVLPAEVVETRIFVLRGHRVILDRDLAELYGVETRAVNQAAKRNTDRFPADFMFQLTPEEAEALLRLRSQSVILKRGQHPLDAMLQPAEEPERRLQIGFVP